MFNQNIFFTLSGTTGQPLTEKKKEDQLNSEEKKSSLKRPLVVEETNNKKTKRTFKISEIEYVMSEELASKKISSPEGNVSRTVCLCRDGEDKLYVVKAYEDVKSGASIIAAIEKEQRINTKLGLAVSSLDNVQTDGTYYTVENYISGKNLLDFLKSITKSEYSLEKKIDVAIKMVEALQVLHDSKILHRDIKLENILYDEVTGIAFIDFELALEVDESLTAKADFKFTPGLIPPELRTKMTSDYTGYIYSNKSDIYLLGLALSEWFQVASEVMNTPRSKNSIFQMNSSQVDLKQTIPIIKSMLEEDPEKRDSLAETLVKLKALKELVVSQQKEEKKEEAKTLA